MHIERLQFSDQALVFDGLNHAPVGLLTIDDPTPAEYELLTVSIAGVTDADNQAYHVPGPVSYFWQADDGTGVFDDIVGFGAGEAARAGGPTFTVTEDLVGLCLARARRVQGRQRRAGTGVLRAVRGGRER